MSQITKSTDGQSAAETLGARKSERVRLYRERPAEAWTTDAARTEASAESLSDPLHTEVEIGHGAGATRLPIAVHERIGGFSETPVPGDVLCAALASCMDSTIRVVAQHVGVQLEELAVRVEADVDVRGTLCVESDVPVGFQQMRVHLRMRLAEGSHPAAHRRLVRAAEHCCVVLHTLRAGVPVAVSVDDD